MNWYIDAWKNYITFSGRSHHRAIDGMVVSRDPARYHVFRNSNHATVAMLQWLVTEQVEEIASADQFLCLVRRAGEKNILAVEDYLADTAEDSH